MQKIRIQKGSQEGPVGGAGDLNQQLALRLPKLWRRADALQEAEFKLPKDSRQRRILKAEEDAVINEAFTVSDLILASRCSSLADAAVKIMLAASALDGVNPEHPPEQKLCRQAYQALHTALPIVAAAAGLDLNSVAGDRYCADYLCPYPEVDLTAVLAEAE